MPKKMNNVKNKISKSFFLLTILFIILIILMIFSLSCSNMDLVSIISIAQENIAGQETQTATTEKNGGKINTSKYEEFDFFDYSKIKIETTKAIDLKLKNSNLYLDNFNDLVILGEIYNDSNISKTNIEITIEILNEKDEIIFLDKISSMATYLRPGTQVPYVYYFTNREKYINISSIKIGVNYKNYFERFKGNVVVLNENFHYLNEGTKKEMFAANGRVVNMGESQVKNVNLFATFYNLKGQVIFIKKCYIPKDSLRALENQDFFIKVLLDNNTPIFTNYSLEVFFEDEIAPLI